jgi:hypothetical protein
MSSIDDGVKFVNECGMGRARLKVKFILLAYSKSAYKKPFQNIMIYKYCLEFFSSCATTKLLKAEPHPKL